MRIIRNRVVVVNEWSRVADQDTLPDGPIIVTLSRWLEQRSELIERSSAVGVCLGPDNPVDVLGQDLLGRPLVALESNGFVDGRCYSQARLLRERHAYGGEIRVLGAHPEHLTFLERCGVNAFELIDGYEPAQALANFDEIRVHYQPATDLGGDTLRWRRHHTRPRHNVDAEYGELGHGI